MEPISATQQKHDLVSKDKTRTIAERFSEAAKSTFIGRQIEISFFTNTINAKELPFIVAFVHGPGGIGKSCPYVNHIFTKMHMCLGNLKSFL